MNITKLSLLLLVAACAAPADETTSESEDDLRVSGSRVTSAFADPSATYLSERIIANLQAVDLSSQLIALAERADGASAAPNGKVSLTELASLEQPALLATLFPEERAALPALWRVMEAARGSAVSTPSLPAIPVAKVTDTSTPAGTLAPPARLAIDSLPEALRQTMRRVQLSRNDDGDAQTVSLQDLRAAQASPNGYTPADIEALQQAVVFFESQAVSSFTTVLSVTPPTNQRTDLGTYGPLTFSVTDTVSYREERRASTNAHSFGGGSLGITLSSVVARTPSVAGLAADGKLLLVNERTRKEFVVDPKAPSIPKGTYTVETWTQGTRQGSYRVRFVEDAVPSAKETALQGYHDYELRAPEGRLSRRPVSAWHSYSVYSMDNGAAFEFVTEAVELPSTFNGETIEDLMMPQVIAPGRYELSANTVGRITIEVSQTGAVFVTQGAERSRAGYQLVSYRAGAYQALLNPNGDYMLVTINAQTGAVDVVRKSAGRVLETVLDASKRSG